MAALQVYTCIKSCTIPEKFVYFRKTTPTTWSIDNIIPVTIALEQNHWKYIPTWTLFHGAISCHCTWARTSTSICFFYLLQSRSKLGATATGFWTIGPIGPIGPFTIDWKYIILNLLNLLHFKATTKNFRQNTAIPMLVPLPCRLYHHCWVLFCKVQAIQRSYL